MSAPIFSIVTETTSESLDGVQNEVHYPGENGERPFDRAFFEIDDVMFEYDGICYSVDLYTTEEFVPELDDVVVEGAKEMRNRRGNRLMLQEFDRIKRNAPQLLNFTSEFMQAASMGGRKLKVFLTHGVNIVDSDNATTEWGASISKYSKTPDGMQPFLEEKNLPAMYMNQAIDSLQDDQTEAVLCLCCNPGGYSIAQNEANVPIIYYTSINAPTGEASELSIVIPAEAI